MTEQELVDELKRDSDMLVVIRCDGCDMNIYHHGHLHSIVGALTVALDEAMRSMRDGVVDKITPTEPTDE